MSSRVVTGVCLKGELTITVFKTFLSIECYAGQKVKRRQFLTYLPHDFALWGAIIWQPLSRICGLGLKQVNRGTSITWCRWRACGLSEKITYIQYSCDGVKKEGIPNEIEIGPLWHNVKFAIMRTNGYVLHSCKWHISRGRDSTITSF